MGIETFTVLAVIVVAGVLFMTDTLSIDLVALLIMATLLLTGIITPDQGIAGFSNRATVTIGALFVLSAGLFKSGAANFAGVFLSRLGRRNFTLTLIAMMLSIGGLSAFLNHTAVVAIFIPIVLDIARDIKVSPSKLLMPLAYSSMFGGACTLIGSSTSILVSSIAEQNGVPPFGMFEFAGLGLVLFATGILYMLLIGRKMIPDRGGDRRKSLAKGHYLTEIVLQSKAKFLGKTLHDSPLVQDLEIESLEIFRKEERLSAPLSAVVLETGDQVRVRCDVEKIRKLQALKGIALKSETQPEVKGEKAEGNLLVEAVVAPGSMLLGRTLRDIGFRSIFGATVHAIRHRGETMDDDLESTTLCQGDVLLIETSPQRLDDLREHNAFTVVAEVELPTFRRSKMVMALAIVIGVVVSSAVGSVTFMTPVGHQVNTMVYGPGRFRFTDFVWTGAPLNFTFWVLSSLLIPRFWHF